MPGHQHIATDCKDKIQAERILINMVELEPGRREMRGGMAPGLQMPPLFQLIIQELCSDIQALPFTDEPKIASLTYE